jgi:PAS domain S-box-containing protein
MEKVEKPRPVFSWQGRSALAVPFALLVLVAGLTFYLEFHERDAFVESRGLVIHSHNIIEAAQTLLSQALDAESGQRGYLLTHDRAYLNSYERASEAAPGSMKALRRSVEGDVDQSRRVDQINLTVQSKLNELAKGVAAAGALPPGRAPANLGEVSMEQIRLAVTDLIGREEFLLEQRRNQYEAVRIRTFRIVVASCLAAMAGLLFSMWVMLRDAGDAARRMSERDDAEAARRESDALYKAMFANAAEYLFVIDTAPDGRLFWADVNPAWEAAIGQGAIASVIRGRSLEETAPPHVAAHLSACVAESIAARGPVTFLEEVNTRAGPRTWETILAPVFDQDRVIRIIGCARDVSARAEAEEQIRRAQRMEAIGQLTGGVAHDFNNLLQVIRANLEMLAGRLSDDEIASQRVRSALHGADQAAQLTRQLLAFARRQPLEPRVVNLGRLVTDMSDLLGRSVGESISVDLLIEPGLWNCLVDPVQVESAVLNLALNARDAMTGGGRLALSLDNASIGEAELRELEDAAPGEYVMLTMTDSGHGMAPEVLARVFEPFFTTKGEEKGTGLGLSMVYGFVKQSRGHLQLASAPGQGTTVKILLPRSHEAEERTTEAPVVTTSRIDTVLVVEDEPAVRAAACAMLQELGYRCLEASDGSQALALLERGAEVQLLFTDMVMPGPVKSTELAALAREMIPDLPILFTSGYAESAVLREGRMEQGALLLSKPYSRAALSTKIQAAIRAVQPVVLVVEDDPLVRLSAADMVEDLGFVAVAVEDAANALQLLQSGTRADVLFTDVGLPDMKGPELAEAALALRPDLPVIFASGYADTGETPPGAVWLSKPYEQRELASALAGLIRKGGPALRAARRDVEKDVVAVGDGVSGR